MGYRVRMTTDAPSRSPRPPRSRGRLLPILTGSFALVAGFVLLCMVLPTMPNAGLFAVSVLAYTVNPFLLVLVALGVLLLVLALRRRRRVLAGVAGALAAALLVAVAVPTAQLAATAAEEGVTLSVPGLLQGPTGGLEAPSATEPYTTVDGEELQMDVWRPDDQQRASNAAMVYVYGGGFESGDRSQWAPFFQHLTSQGITVFSMDYRLSTPEDPSWDEAAGDVRCAVGWVHANAERFGVDERRIGISGGSAGANLALLTAYSSDSDAIEPSCAVEDGSVRAVVDYYGPADLAELHAGTPSAAVVDSLEQYLDATPVSDPERYALLSPVTYIDAQSPPTLIVQGQRDTGVQASISTDLAARLDAAGVANELLLLPATEHGFDAVFGAFASQIARERVDAFLREHLIG